MPTRKPLSRKRILDAAVRLADRGGIEAVTMRRLGEALGVEAMSLYNHVSSKDDILGGILDRVAAEFELPGGADDWRASIRRSALSAHEALRRHPWASDLMLSSRYVSPARIRYMDALLALLRTSGFSPEQTYDAYHVLDAHIFGFTLWLAGHSMPPTTDMRAAAKDFLQDFPLDDYPDLATHVEQHLDPGTHSGLSTFEFSLDLILDGLEALRTAGHG